MQQRAYTTRQWLKIRTRQRTEGHSPYLALIDPEGKLYQPSLRGLVVRRCVPTSFFLVSLVSLFSAAPLHTTVSIKAYASLKLASHSVTSSTSSLNIATRRAARIRVTSSACPQADVALIA